MVCGSCGRAAKAGARFCGGCGASLVPRCPACGTECEPDLRFCEACGAALAAGPAEAAGARKVVTIVFADLVGSTSLHERLDAEAVRQFMEGYYAAMRGAVEAHGGRVTQLMGDGVKAVFGAPRVAEDDAIRAVRAGVEMQHAFRALADEQRERVGKTGLRVAVNTGEVVADEGSEIIGDPVNVAARLQEQGRDGDVVIGGATQRIVASLVTLDRLGSFALKGRSESVEAYRVVSLERPAGVPATPFVGRDDELRRLRALYEVAVGAPAARLAVLLGSPGLGKSRLLAELARQLEGRARVLTAHCNPAGGATFAPLADALRASFPDETNEGDAALRAALAALVPPKDDAERAAIAVGMDAVLAGKPALPEEIFFVVRRLLTALAAEQPVVLVIDDLQWAEPLLLDFTEHLVQWGAGVPLLVLVAARPELRDARSSFSMPGGLVSEVVTLGGLDAGAAMRLAANVIGAETLPAAIAGRVLTTSEGNPLFVGELVRMLVNDGVLQKQGDQWSLAVELAALDMPPTIQALLAARIERLRPEERLVLERAAVVGRRFSRTAVTHLLPREAHAELDTKLEALRRSELIEPDGGWLFGEPALRFHHTLIRDAAYRRVLRGTRAELHARFADWLEARAAGSLEHEETIGWHLEQAHQHLRELGPLDAAGHALGERAGKNLAAAGQRALARDDLQPAASLLGRALACLGEAAPARAELALDWCEALLAAGEVGPAAQALAELGRFTAASERLRAWHTCFSGQLAALADPKALRASAESVAAAAEALAAAGDVAGEAKAHAVHADALARLGRIGACEAALDKALAAARRINDRRRANAVLAGAPLAALWGPSPVTRASGRCLDVVRVLRITQGAPAVEAVALRCQAVLETLRGRSEAARRMLASSRRLVEELGITQRLLEVEASTGLIELLEGDAAAAERSLGSAYDGFRARGLGVDAARAAALLGRAVLAQGRAAEAEALSRESEALAGDDFKAAIGWRGVRAEALAARGEHAPAIELARAAVEIAAATDDLLDHADARSALAVTLRAAGRSQEADAEEARALQLWEQKGATLLAERARRGAERVVQAPSLPAAPAARVPPPRPGPPVPHNRVTANAVQVGAAIAARDLDALEELHADGMEAVLHKNGLVLDRQENLAWWRLFFADEGARFELDPIATLGDSLALFRQCWSGSASDAADFPVGAFANDELHVSEVDASGRLLRVDCFDADRLGEATSWLYARHAELLPEGPERALATATARSVATLMHEGGLSFDDLERFARILAPDVERIDHRNLSLAAARGREALVETFRVQAELSERLKPQIDDVLGVRRDALLLRCGFSGTLRDGGGTYEQHFLLLICYGAGGLVTRTEWFDAEREADALARFEDLTALPPETRHIRRVRANAATACEERVAAAVAARDLAAIDARLAPDVEVVSHAAGVSYDRMGALASFRGMLRPPDLTYRIEPLASLGDRLALARQRVTGSGSVGAIRDLGAYEAEFLVVTEVDDMGRRRRFEMFAPERIGDAVARLYERFAELLPEGAERVRATATARSVAVAIIRPTPALVAPGVVFADHRTVVNLPPAQGASEYLRRVAHWFESADARYLDDIVELRPAGLVVRRFERGRHPTGGDFENVFLVSFLFDEAGRVTCTELFDADREAEALARFDSLVAEPPITPSERRRVRPNVATTHVDRLNAASAERDLDALASLLSERVRILNHTIGVGMGRHEVLDWWRLFYADRDGAYRLEPLATLGESLALVRQSWTGSASAGGALEVGAFEIEMCLAYEVDAQGQVVWVEAFGRDRLGDALFRLYERHAELLPEGPAKTRAEAIARSAPVLGGPTDLERFAAALSPDVEFQDHRTLGLASARGRDVMLGVLASLLETAPDSTNRVDDVLALSSDAFLVRVTNFGTSSIGGGAYERPFLIIWTFGADGLVSRSEQFDVGREAEALARFEEVTTPWPAPRVARRVRPNAATANSAHFEAALAARDGDALPALWADRFEVVDHQTGVQYDRQGSLATWRAALRIPDFRYRQEPLGTLGASLLLLRQSESGSSGGGRLDVGPFERDEVVLLETDSEGRRRRSEIFSLAHLGDAIVRLYERYAELLPEGAERARAAQTARSVAVWSGPLDLERYAGTLARSFESVDHRTLGTWSGHGAEQWLAHWRSQGDLAMDFGLHDDDVLALASDAVLLRRTYSGTDRSSEGAYETPLLALFSFGSDGLVTRAEAFDPDREADALARFDELTAAASQTPFANAAWRVVGALDRAMEQRDWDAVVALEAPGYVMDDRRALVRSRVQGDASLANLRLVFDAGRSLSRRLIATRGERLALDRQLRTSVDRHGGVAEFAYLGLNELDATGRLAATVLFDPDDLDAAYAELDARYDAGEAAPYARTRALSLQFTRAIAARDWEGLASVLTPDFMVEDHRLLGTLSSLSREEWVAAARALVDLRPDVVLRPDHVLALDDRRFLAISRWVGGEAEGAFELPTVVVTEHGAAGMRRWHVYDLDQLDTARARYAELAAPPRTRWVPNAATRNLDRLQAAWEARDWERLASEFAPEFRGIDRRPRMLLELDRDQQLAFLRIVFDMADSRQRYEVLATRGERLALARLHFVGAEPGAGPSEIESLILIEVKENGQRIAAVRFEADDLDAAYVELDTRYGTSKAQTLLLRGISARDWDAVAAVLAPDLVVEDHRRLGWGTLHGPEAYLAALRALVELAPDATLRLDHLEESGRATLGLTLLSGTREGGAFEDARALVVERDARARIRRIDFYELDQLDVARARYAAIGRPRTPRIENAATRAMDAFSRSWDARDWEGVVRHWAPLPRLIDRRPLVGVDHEGDEVLASLRLIYDQPGSRWQHEVLATRGERLGLLRWRWLQVGDGDEAVLAEVEYLGVVEVDADGRQCLGIFVDAASQDAAYAELDARYAAGEAAPHAGTLAVMVRAREAMAAHDWERLASLFAPDFVQEDHRSLGLLNLSLDDWLRSLGTLSELRSDATFRAEHILALDAHRSLSVARWVGSDREGAFETPMVLVNEHGPDVIRRSYVYDLEQLDAAWVRYDALGASPREPRAALVPPNAATAAVDRLEAAFEARDWAAVRSLVAEGARFEDRRRQMLHSGDVDWLVASLELEIGDSGLGGFQRRLVATAGDRICLERSLWSGGPSDGRVEIEYLWLAEVDAAGRLVGGVVFDVDDHRAAQREVLARWIAADAVAAVVLKPLFELIEGHNDRDAARMRAVLADDHVLDDHTRTGIGHVEGLAAYLQSFEAYWRLTREARLEVVSFGAIAPNGVVGVARTGGTAADGGAFENVYAFACTVAGGRIQRTELFEVDQLDAAVARLAELRPDPLRIPPNAATRATDRYERCVAVEDWDALRAVYAPTLVFDDRRRLVRTMGDREMFVENCRLVARSTRLSRTLLATAGDRLALERFLWTGAHHGGAFEMEHLTLVEVDEEGLCVVVIMFDPDDRRAASREMLERWAKTEAIRGLPTLARRAILDRDLARLRAALPADFVFHDHRHSGAGRVEGADAYVAWTATLLEASPDAILEPLYYVAVEEHAFLSVSHTFGTLVDGGAFESVFAVVAGPGFTELYEIDDLERARARFEELRPDPTRIPPNAASRAAERISELHGARDWAALRALTAPDFTFDDRQKRALVTGGVELWIQNLEFVTHPGRATRELIGSAGDRVALQHVAFAGESEGGAFEAELLVLTEVAADGRLRARISFDPDDRAAAFGEAHARFVAGEADGVGGQAPLLAMSTALRSRDWEGVRSCLAEDFTVRDQRTPALLGTLDREGWIESLRALVELAPDWGTEWVRILAWNARGRVSLTRSFGTREGGSFENRIVMVQLTSGDRLQRLEVFDAADADRALARFEELCAGRP